MYIVTADGSFLDWEGLSNTFANCSIPREMSEEDAAFLGVHIVHDSPLPTLDEGYRAVPDGADLNPADGKYYMRWKTERIPPLEQAEAILRLIDSMETADKTGRGSREALIAITSVLAQAQGKDEAWLMANNITYRKFKLRDNEIQALRAKYLSLISEVPNATANLLTPNPF